MDCPVCYYPFSKSRIPKILTLCGHSLCEMCAKALNLCLECKKNIDSVIPNHQLIKVINAKKSNNLFENASAPPQPPPYTELLISPLNNANPSSQENPNLDVYENSSNTFTRFVSHTYNLSLKRKSIQYLNTILYFIN